MMVYNVIAMTVIAIAGVMVFIVIISVIQPNLMSPALCSVYQAALGVIPMPKESKPTLPSYCLPQTCEIQRFRIDEKANIKSKEDLDKRFADIALQCWKCADSGRKAMGILCFDGYSVYPVTEKGITEAIEAQGKCDFLPNSFLDYEKQSYSCGTANKLFFNSEKKELKEEIVIKYDAFAHRIVIS